MKLHIVWSVLAAEQLADHFKWLLSRNSKAAFRFTEHMNSSVELLGEHPELAPVWLKSRDGRVRVLTVGDHLVFYEVYQAQSEILILSVRHGRQRELSPSDL